MQGSLWAKYRNTTNFPDYRNPLLCPLGGPRTRLGMGLNRAVLLEASRYGVPGEQDPDADGRVLKVFNG